MTDDGPPNVARFHALAHTLDGACGACIAPYPKLCRCGARVHLVSGRPCCAGDATGSCPQLEEVEPDPAPPRRTQPKA